MSKDTGKPYYDTIKDEPTLARAAQGKATLATLLRAGWKSAVSQWGREQLLAHRVVCNKPGAKLSFLEPFLRDPSSASECIADLIKGPVSIDALKDSSETQIMHLHKPDSLGYVWAAFLPFLRTRAALAVAPAPVGGAPSTPQPKRARKAPERYGDGVPSDQVDLGSSPDSHSTEQRPPTSKSDSSFSSAGYMDRLGESLFEDVGIRLASCFIRCVLNYAQPTDKHESFVEFRDERLTHIYWLDESRKIHAVDDGGMEVFGSKVQQVALLEGKRNIQKITDGVADITDELLGQMVGQALALRQTSPDSSTTGNPRSDIMTILVATHYVKLFHFHFPEDYINSYSNRSSIGPGQGILDGVLTVNSTKWLDIKINAHRKTFASHVLALVAWANKTLD